MKRVTASIGVAVFPDHGQELDDVVAAADLAMYQAKRDGRDRIAIAPISLSEPGGRRPVTWSRPDSPRTVDRRQAERVAELHPAADAQHRVSIDASGESGETGRWSRSRGPR